MLRMSLTILFFGLANASQLYAFDVLDDPLVIEEVLPLFNVHENKASVGTEERKINPEPINISDNAKIGIVNEELSVEGLIGEVVYKDIILKPTAKNYNVVIKVQPVDAADIKIDAKLVSSWYQSGISSHQKRNSGELTYELLLSDDHAPEFNDKWVKSKKGGWVYVPPDVKKRNSLNTTLLAGQYKRVLIKVVLGRSLAPGKYRTNIEIVGHEGTTESKIYIPLLVDVKSVRLTEKDQLKYKMLLFTAFKLDDRLGRPGAYINAMRLYGSEEVREQQMMAYLQDIRSHGFNGITIRDWDQKYLNKILEMTKKVGIKYVVLHATSPVGNKDKGIKDPIVSERVKTIYKNNDKELYFYGYDESGGNKLLAKQLKLNQRIHAIGGKSVNAIFWDDMAQVKSAINDDKSKCFDIVGYSMGSHGHRKMFRSLPYKKMNDTCSNSGTEYLSYWHPNIENPVTNRLFMGFWLWASGLDGVIPHGYYFPSHVEKVLSKKDLKHGKSNVTSPYNDWSFWLPGAPLRHHNAVYPSKNGPIGTLQWEGILSGNMDLKYALMLEEKLEDASITSEHKLKIRKLLDKIRRDVLSIDSPYMGDKESIVYLKKLESWKRQIRDLLAD